MSCSEIGYYRATKTLNSRLAVRKQMEHRSRRMRLLHYHWGHRQPSQEGKRSRRTSCRSTNPGCQWMTLSSQPYAPMLCATGAAQTADRESGHKYSAVTSRGIRSRGNHAPGLPSRRANHVCRLSEQTKPCAPMNVGACTEYPCATGSPRTRWWSLSYCTQSLDRTALDVVWNTTRYRKYPSNEAQICKQRLTTKRIVSCRLAQGRLRARGGQKPRPQGRCRPTASQQAAQRGCRQHQSINIARRNTAEICHSKIDLLGGHITPAAGVQGAGHTVADPSQHPPRLHLLQRRLQRQNSTFAIPHFITGNDAGFHAAAVAYKDRRASPPSAAVYTSRCWCWCPPTTSATFFGTKESAVRTSYFACSAAAPIKTL